MLPSLKRVGDLLFPFADGFSGLVLGLLLGSAISAMAGFPAPKSVITLAGFQVITIGRF